MRFPMILRSLNDVDKGSGGIARPCVALEVPSLPNSFNLSAMPRYRINLSGLLEALQEF
jgi:hypothetical protein